MKTYHLLRQFRSHKDIQSQKQLYKINGEAVDLDLELDIHEDGQELGEFVYANMMENQAGFDFNVFRILEIRDFFGRPAKSPELQFLSGYLLLQLGKKEEYVFMYKN